MSHKFCTCGCGTKLTNKYDRQDGLCSVNAINYINSCHGKFRAWVSKDPIKIQKYYDSKLTSPEMEILIEEWKMTL